MRSAQGHWCCTPAHYNSYFSRCTYEKNIFSSSFYQRFFFVNFLTEKLLLSCQNITCLLEIQARFLFFSLRKIKISKQQIYPLNYLLQIGLILTISKVFTILCLLCLCWEHPGSLRNKSICPPFSWVSRYILFLAKVKGRGRPFWRVHKGRKHCEITLKSTWLS